MSENKDHLEPNKTYPKKESFFDLIKFALIAIIIVVPLRVYVAKPFIVSGQSMQPTFENGEYLIIDQVTYKIEEPMRGDVVVFRYPNDLSKFYIKRIVGLPNEIITLSDGKLFVTDQDGLETSIEEPYIAIQSHENFRQTLNEGQFFVMGDNRPASHDSRFWGPLNEKLIIGRPLIRLFPVTKIDLFPGQ